MIPRRLYLAVLFAFLLHGFFILTARYRLSYDAYIHMLFADHYASNWYSLWETRWYTGFNMVSYPPLTHQLIAVFIPILGFDAAYAFILWVVTTLFPLGVYAFSRIFSGKTASSYAALASALLLPLYVTAHIFGQLPFLTATLFALFGTAAIAKFLREGSLSSFLFAVSITATTIAAHHATIMILPFFIFALAVFQLNKQHWKTILIRLGLFALFSISAGVVVIWPFWKWGLHQQIQIPIDHLSRHNFITDPFAQTIFFWPFYFPIGAVIPFIYYKWPRKYLGLQLTFFLLFLLGLGGTTPLPKLLFGKGWEWLTYDRFVFWATLILTPFFGMLFIRFRRWIKKRLILNLIPVQLRGKLISAFTFSIFACSALGSWFTPLFFRFQPDPVDMQPIVDFLEAEDHYYWRYLTFGFGDQFAYLSLLTKAETLDGSYHTARTIPELRQSGIGQIDTALWALKGIPAIEPILKASGEYGVRWGFVNRREYIPTLKKNGWVFVKFLNNGVQVWENPKFTFKPPVIPPASPIKSFSWGIFPMLSLITTLALAAATTWPQQEEKVIRKTYTMLLGLMPLSFGFWYYIKILNIDYAKINFIYTHILFFLSDALAVTAVILWLAVKVQKKHILQVPAQLKWLFAFCCWITLSTFWSLDWRISLYLSLHYWLIFLLILSMQDWHEAQSSVLLGLGAGIMLQAIVGIIELKTQSTELLKPFKLNVPGLINADSAGASILKFANGENFLRVYGAFPHPNILGGFVLISIAMITAYLLLNQKKKWLTASLLVISTFLLAIAFSRSAWLGVIIFFLVIFLKSKFFSIKKLWGIFFILIITFTLTLFPLKELFLSRTTAPVTEIEKNSLVGRIWFIEQALEQIKEHPLAGSGVGTFIIQLARRATNVNSVDQVHNVPLLVFSDLGLIGFILLSAVAISIIKELFITKKTGVILIGALLAGVGTISLFDHYFWSLAPGRMMLGLVLGLWYGQVTKDAE